MKGSRKPKLLQGVGEKLRGKEREKINGGVEMDQLDLEALVL